MITAMFLPQLLNAHTRSIGKFGDFEPDARHGYPGPNAAVDPAVHSADDTSFEDMHLCIPRRQFMAHSLAD